MQGTTRPQYIPLQVMSSEPIVTRREPTDTLLTTDHISTPTSRSKQPSPKPTFLHPTMWMWELLSLVCASLILIAIVIILAAYDGKPSLVVGGITLNTVVAFAATLFRVCVMIPVTECFCQLTWVRLQKDYMPLQEVARFDAASRGPLGSLYILSEFRSNPVVFLAGIVVIIGIAIAPSFQQSVTFDSAIVKTRDSTQSGLASAAFTYSGSADYIGENNATRGSDIPFNLRSAIYTGLYSTSIIGLPQAPYSCPTGNCTWDPFPTLSVSVQCFDDAKNYFLNCTESDSISLPGRKYTPCTMVARNWTQIWPPSSHTVFDGAGFWQGYSPSGSIAPYNSPRFEYGFTKQPEDTWASINAGFAGFRWNLARGLLVSANPPIGPVITSESVIEAGYCIFYPNMQTISARVQNGIYEEHIINSTMQIQPYHDEEDTRSYNIGPDETDDLTYTFYPDCQNAAGKCESEADPRPVNITIPRQRYSNLMAAIALILPVANVSTTRQDFLLNSGAQNPVAAGSLYRTHNITATMHTIAHYISVALRANDTILALQNDPRNAMRLPADYIAPTHRVVGTVYVQTVLLRVRWGWLAFPTVLVLIVAGVLFETILTSEPDSVGVWKNYLLALLLNTQWRPESRMTGAGTSAELEKIAKSLEVRVVRGDGVEGEQRTVSIRKRVIKLRGNSS